jgi:amidase
MLVRQDLAVAAAPAVDAEVAWRAVCQSLEGSSMLTQQEWEAQDALGIATLVKTGAISAREAVETAIARIEQLNPIVNAVVCQSFDSALELAHRLKPTGPFAGVPYLLKDLNAPAQGLPLTNGSRLLANAPATFDSSLVARLKAAGFLIIGRTNTPEFGLNITTEPQAYGPTRNPWQLDRIAGGSSGGSGAAVASGMVPAAHATDSGGSIRIPAACNGLVGLKPSRGLNPAGPHRAQANEGISHENLVSRSVRDTAAILDVTSGPDAGAPYFFRKPPIGFLKAIQQRGKPLRIALMTKTFTGEPICADAREGVERTGVLLSDMGHHVEEAAPHFDYDVLQQTIFSILFANLAAGVTEFEQQRGSPAAPDELEPLTQAALERGRAMTLPQYFAAVAQLNRQVRRIGAFFESQDVLVTPVLATELPALGCLPTDGSDLDAHVARFLGIAPFPLPFNGTGQPAISLPLHWTPGGLPVGIQFVGRLGQDASLLHLAARLEEARNWFGNRPTLREAAPL